MNAAIKAAELDSTNSGRRSFRGAVERNLNEVILLSFILRGNKASEVQDQFR